MLLPELDSPCMWVNVPVHAITVVSSYENFKSRGNINKSIDRNIYAFSGYFSRFISLSGIILFLVTSVKNKWDR